MATLGAVLKSEVRKLAGREVRAVMRAIRKVQRQVKLLRNSMRDDRRTLSALDSRLTRLRERRGSGRRGRRVSSQGVRAVRARLHMTRLQFSTLLGVSPGSIFGWESGRTVPRGGSAARLAVVRKMGAKEAWARVKADRGVGARQRKTRRRRSRR